MSAFPDLQTANQMTDVTNRPYRKARSKEKTLEYIRGQSWKHFDPQLVEVLLEVIINTANTV
ncbi:MAG: hypothetical protein Q7T89_04530 [Anaerolineales bacterium]|nr:hypothetical protein [Anaerolineales bacterium]